MCTATCTLFQSHVHVCVYVLCTMCGTETFSSQMKVDTATFTCILVCMRTYIYIVHVHTCVHMSMATEETTIALTGTRSGLLSLNHLNPLRLAHSKMAWATFLPVLLAASTTWAAPSTSGWITSCVNCTISSLVV